MSAKFAVLGLVIEQPGYAWRIAMKARQQLRFADLADSYPYWALEKLEAEGLVRQIYEDGALARKHRAGRQAIYETTREGLRAFGDWLWSAPEDPLLRDNLQFRLAVARQQDMLRIIELIRERELLCAAHEQMLQRVDSKDWSTCSSAQGEVVRDVELMFWRGRIAWLRGIRETLEKSQPE